MRYVYILRCKDNTLYTGITNDLTKRVFDHNNSSTWAKYTKSRRPVKLVWTKRVKDKVAASKQEYLIKTYTKPQKESLIARRRISPKK